MAHEAAGELEQHRAGVALQRALERPEQHYMRAVALVGAGGGGGGGRGGRRGGGAGPRRVAPRVYNFGEISPKFSKYRLFR